MKRTIDVVLAAGLLVVAAPLAALLAVLVTVTSPGPVLYWSDRVGRHNEVFRMPKFRTMRVDTPVLATHLMTEPDRYLTPVGGFLRRTSLDEIPQIWSILTGRMSFVGPRPALFNQDDLIALRTATGVHELTPGLTGWAQIRGRDDLPIPRKVELDVEYLRRRSIRFDLCILWQTAAAVRRGDGVAH